MEANTVTALVGPPSWWKRNLAFSAFFIGCGCLFGSIGIADKSTAGMVLGSAALLVAAGFGYSVASPHLRTRRARRVLASTPRTFVCDVHDGALVKITGRVRLTSEASLIAPFSGKQCAYYSVRICERTSNEGIEDWREVRRMERSVDFQLEDETGSAWVRMTRPAVVTEPRPLDPSELSSPRLDEFLRRARLEHVELADSSEEVILEQGQIVSVVGLGRWEVTRDPAASAAYREAPRTVVMSAPPFRPILIGIDAAPVLPNE